MEEPESPEKENFLTKEIFKVFNRDLVKNIKKDFQCIKDSVVTGLSSIFQEHYKNGSPGSPVKLDEKAEILVAKHENNQEEYRSASDFTDNDIELELNVSSDFEDEFSDTISCCSDDDSLDEEYEDSFEWPNPWNHFEPKIPVFKSFLLEEISFSIFDDLIFDDMELTDSDLKRRNGSQSRRRYRPYSVQSLHHLSDRNTSEEIDEKKFLKTLFDKCEWKKLKKMKVDKYFLSLLHINKWKLPKGKHHSMRVKFIIDQIKEDVVLYKSLKHALVLTCQNKTLNYLTFKENEVAMLHDTEYFFGDTKEKRHRFFRSRYDEELEIRARKLNLFQFLADVDVKTSRLDNIFKIERPALFECSSVEKTTFEKKNSSKRDQKCMFSEKIQTRGKERRYTASEKRVDFEKQETFNFGLLFMTIGFGKGLSITMKALMLFSLIGCSVGVDSVPLTSSWDSMTYQLQTLEMLNQGKIFIEWQNVKGFSRWDNYFNLVDTALTWEKMNANLTKTPVFYQDICQRHLNKAVKIENELSHLKSLQGQWYLDYTGSGLQFQKLQKTIDTTIGKNLLHALPVNQQNRSNHDGQNKDRDWMEFEQWTDEIKLSKQYFWQLSIAKLCSSFKPVLSRFNETHSNDETQWLYNLTDSTIWTFVNGLPRGSYQEKTPLCFNHSKKSSVGRIKQLRKRLSLLFAPLDRKRMILRTMTSAQLLKFENEVSETSDEKFNELDEKLPRQSSDVLKMPSENMMGKGKANKPVKGFVSIKYMYIEVQDFNSHVRFWIKCIEKLMCFDHQSSQWNYFLWMNSSSQQRPLISQEYHYSNSHHYDTMTESLKNRSHFFTPAKNSLQDDDLCRSKYFSLEFIPLYCFIFIISLFIFGRVVVFRGKRERNICEKPPISNPVKWILCILYTANTSDLVWLWGTKNRFCENVVKEEKEESEKSIPKNTNKGIQEICQSSDHTEIIVKDVVLQNKTNETEGDECLKTQHNLVKGNEETFQSLLGKCAISAEDVEKERKFQKHKELVELVYGTEKEEGAKCKEELFSNDEDFTPIHDYCEKKGIEAPLSKTEEIIFEYFLKTEKKNKDGCTLVKEHVAKPHNSLENRENAGKIDIRDATSKKSHGTLEVAKGVCKHKNHISLLDNSSNKLEIEGSLMLTKDIHNNVSLKKTLCLKGICMEVPEETSKISFDKQMLNDTVPSGNPKNTLQFNEAQNKVSCFQKSDLRDALAETLKSSLPVEHNNEFLDLKTKEENGKQHKTNRSNHIVEEVDLAFIVRDYTWLPLSELPVPKVEITAAFVTNFEPLMSIIDQIANGTPPTPHISMRYELLRFCTLRSYPKENKPFIIKLAEAGFYYASDGDGVVCYCCGIRRYNWVEEDIPMKIHKRVNPNCKFLKKNEEVNVPVQYFGPYSKSLMAIMDIPEPVEREDRSEDVNNDWAPERVRSPAPSQQNRRSESAANSLGINTATPKHTQYATKTARVGSYSGWPDTASHTPEVLADAGFFYAGFGDCVRCFYCGIGLRHWTKEDDPWIEHARWARNCVFVKQKKGEEFVNLVQMSVQQSQENEMQAQAQANSNAGNQLPVQDIDRLLLSDAAQSVLDMGYQPRIIRNALEQILRQNGNVKITAQILMEKVLEIEESENQNQAAPVAQAAASATASASAASSLTKPASQKHAEAESAKAEGAKAEGANAESANAESAKAEGAKASAKSEKQGAEEAKQSKDKDNTKTADEASQDPKAIKAENEQLKEQTLCKVCLDNTVCIVFLPCGHLVTCADCAPAMRKCPICRALVKGTVRTYMS